MFRPARPVSLVLAAALSLGLVLIQVLHVARGADSDGLPAGLVMTALGPAELCGDTGPGHEGPGAAHCPDCLPGAAPALLAGGPAGPPCPAVPASPAIWHIALSLPLPVPAPPSPPARGPPAVPT